MLYLIPLWRCSDCQKYKRLEEFHKSMTLKARPIQHKCKECEKKYKRQNPHVGRTSTKNWRLKNKIKRQQYLDKNKEKIAAQRKDYYKRKKDHILSKNKEWHQNNRGKEREQKRQYYEKNKEKRDAYRRSWVKRNKDRLNKKTCIANKLRRKTNYQFVIAERMTKLLRYGLKNQKNNKKTSALLGYSMLELIKHLESTFIEEMSWENLLKGRIQIHHIIPAAAFEYKSETDEAFKLCWSLKNLCAEWSILNQKLNDVLPDGTCGKRLATKIKNKEMFDFYYPRCLAMRVVIRLKD